MYTENRFVSICCDSALFSHFYFFKFRFTYSCVYRSCLSPGGKICAGFDDTASVSKPSTAPFDSLNELFISPQVR